MAPRQRVRPSANGCPLKKKHPLFFGGVSLSASLPTAAATRPACETSYDRRPARRNEAELIALLNAALRRTDVCAGVTVAGIHQVRDKTANWDGSICLGEGVIGDKAPSDPPTWSASKPEALR